MIFAKVQSCVEVNEFVYNLEENKSMFMMLENTQMLNYLKTATIYEVNLRQYTKEGNIKAFIQHLPRLKSMGVDILWFMPIHPIGIKNRKGSLGSYYCSKDFFDLNPEYGTKDDFRNLVNEVHNLGIKIIIDWVANHAAWDNHWTESHPDYFVRNEDGTFYSPYDWTDVIQIDHNNEAAHDAMRDAMCYWVSEFDIDGFRADLAHLTPLRFWIKARRQTEALKPNLIWLAETEDAAYYEAFDIFYAWKWMHKSETFVKENQTVDLLIAALKEQNEPYPTNALQLYFTTNHDENSWNGTEFEKYGIYAKAFSVFSFFYPSSVPLIYSGQELPNYKRLLFFDKDEIEWTYITELQEFYSMLITKRKQLNVSDNIEFLSIHNKFLSFKRGDGIGSILLFFNFDKENFNCDYDLGINKGDYKNIFEENNIEFIESLHINLNPGAFLILERVS